jgi:hypothetical protein
MFEQVYPGLGRSMMSVLSRLFGTTTRSVDAVEAKDLQRSSSSVVVVDVRGTSEWGAGRTPRGSVR